MSSRDDDHIGHVPKITPAHDEIASFQRTKAKGALAASIGDVPNVSGPATSSAMVMKSTLTAVVLVLLATEPDAETESKLSDFVTELWDLGLEIGHSVRTLDECIDEAKADLTIITNLIESKVSVIYDN